jgi:hypothetical protein
VLDLVQNDQSAQRLEREHGITQASAIDRVFEIEECRRTAPALDEASRECRFSDLAGAE